MSEAALLVADARRSAGLSVRELARLAGVSFTTITRVESGQLDPTVGMLLRILAGAGQRLQLNAVPLADRRRTLADLADRDLPDWTRLRAFLDHLARHPDEVEAAITARPHPPSRLMDALLAGIAEKLADDHGLPRPGWTRTAPRMRPEWSPPATPRILEQRRRATPRQLLDRGIVVDEHSLWRDPETIDA
jgi:transcriptional regulator with XRE-family HTH domain